jgi:hypothetical protein
MHWAATPHSVAPINAAFPGLLRVCVRGCESSRPSQPVLRLAIVCNLRLTGPEIPAFRVFDFVSRLPISHSGSEAAESLRPYRRKFPFCRDYRRRPVRSRLPPAALHPLGVFCSQATAFNEPSARQYGASKTLTSHANITAEHLAPRSPARSETRPIEIDRLSAPDLPR